MNQGVIDAVIGDANYDVGHVFTTASGGVAGLGVVGITGQKARGTTGLSSPTGDLFFVDFVAHELGHQYGGSHTFNGTRGNCAGNASASQINRVEPGSGSTLQSYAGICGLDDLQNAGQAGSGDGTNASDPYFHSRSFDQIKSHVDLVVPGAGTAVATGNDVPTVDAGPDVVVPSQTPFFLTATGSDGDAGDVLTYNYEQRDGGAAPRVLDSPQVTSGPLFRSFPRPPAPRPISPDLPTSHPATRTRTARVPRSTARRELLPIAGPSSCHQSPAHRHSAIPCPSRSTPPVHDNRAGGGGVNTDDTVVTVHNTGTAFRVAAPNGGGPTLSGSTTVTWNVAGTTAAPVSAANVSIRLSIDGGLTYPIELVTNTPNDGSQPVALPSITTSTARIMVHSGTYTGSGFFDITDTNFSLEPGQLTVPGTPAAVTGVGRDGSVLVSWTPPVSTGGSPIIGYLVTATPGGRSCTTSGATSCTVAGLMNGTPYTFAVAAINVVGTGSAASSLPVIPAGVGFVPLTPSRILNTRGGAKVGDAAGTGASLVLRVSGAGGVPA